MVDKCKWKPLDYLFKNHWIVHDIGFYLPCDSEPDQELAFVYCPFCGKRIEYLPYKKD